ncbi:MAG: aspartate--ammonia ligase [Bacteroidales bacterium]
MGYSKLLEEENKITYVKECFERELCKNLGLVKISSPIALLEGTGINDDLNGIERPVSFSIKALGERKAQIVHSLAKWKRIRLAQLQVAPGEGVVADMRALRPEENDTHIHSVLVDQWDWEQRIERSSRTLSLLKERVRMIYAALKESERQVALRYGDIEPSLPEEITFIHSQELLDLYPNLDAKEREQMGAKKWGALFIIGIGGKLSNGEPHDGRAPDYDDWSTLNQEGYWGLNGDIIVWHPVLNMGIELSSMGVRVDKESLLRQLDIKGCRERESLYFHKLLLEEALPQSIGGGIGQSRVVMTLLKKRHIGEVQVGIWSAEQRSKLAQEGITLL